MSEAPSSGEFDPGHLAQRARAELIEALVTKLCARKSGTFARGGEALLREHLAAILAAIAQDLSQDRRDAIRGATQRFIADYLELDLTFFDLRSFSQSLRERVLEHLGHGELREQGEALLFDMVLVSSMRFMARRDELAQVETAKHDLERVESQLAELEAALAEKTRLLDVLRQASTPIAPVSEGILVVPLVGAFDAFRAELLTEKLLTEIGRVHARTAILDISGAPVLDTQAAHLIIRMSRTVRLLGTRLILVGMSADNARTIVELGVELDEIETFGTLRDGLARALLLQRLKITPI
ncbi:STAS domain-containing protein [Pseudenhygromyxa sp. WMMC2535]|uniref:STAS domain-containing protein n=1 Tax=Pseudenhygromyxa sp. WMMC2535 TaxID=2712867 RepID=UPI0015582F41|nr:STAS domain-containing protein [Pseudenhygromyxa sp. WMMC2535]NVB38236.1 STAS domain-containing protein [Pseudenhygromyxa sp. WMMC2535]NVB43593.1 STAS domain-containing protein [Pseudenhygromyxa sp. WMMC2535]